jgi:chromosome segregation ATPase
MSDVPQGPDSDMAFVVTTLAALQQGLQSVIEGQARLEAQALDTRTALMARMDRLQARIDQLGDEWFVAYAQHEGIDRKVDSSRTELRELRDQLSGLIRQVRSLRDRIDAIEGP